MYIHLYSGNYSPETDDKRELNRKKKKKTQVQIDGT